MYIHLAVALVPSRAKVSFNKEKIAFVYDYTYYEHFFIIRLVALMDLTLKLKNF